MLGDSGISALAFAKSLVFMKTYKINRQLKRSSKAQILLPAQGTIVTIMTELPKTTCIQHKSTQRLKKDLPFKGRKPLILVFSPLSLCR